MLARPTVRGESVRWSVFAIVLLWTSFPLYWMLATALRPSSEVFRRPLTFWPETVTLQNFETVVTAQVPILRWLVNSMLTASATALLVLILALPAGYAFSRMRFPMREGLFVAFVLSQMIPLVVLLLPLYIIFFRVSLLDSYVGLVLGFTSFSLPFAVWVIKTFVDSVPIELEDAARVDGCGRIQALRLVVTPVLGPGLIAAGVLTFLDAWNNLLFPLALTTSLDMKTLPPGMLLAFDGQFRRDWGGLMATSLITAVPVIVLFVPLQRWLVGGLTQGSVKG